MKEEAKVKVKAAPRKPSQSEVEEHMASGHVNYRSWCPHCVRGQAVNDPHKSAKEESEHPIISMDYTYFGESSEERKGGR